MLTGCTNKQAHQVEEILAQRPFACEAIIKIGNNQYPSTIERNEAGEVTVIVLPEKWTMPIIYKADAQQSNTTCGEYSLTDSVEDSPAASVAVLLRQTLLRLAAQPAEKQNDKFVAKSGGLSVIIDVNSQKIEQISMPGIEITIA